MTGTCGQDWEGATGGQVENSNEGAWGSGIGGRDGGAEFDIHLQIMKLRKA